MRSSWSGAAWAGSVCLALSIGSAGGASIRVSGPAEIVPGVSYTAYVEAENTGLDGMATDGVQWRLFAPTCLSFSYVGKPSSGDFFSASDGSPLEMFVEFFGNPHSSSSTGVSGRLVLEIGAGPTDRPWNSGYNRVGQYEFQINPATPPPLPSGGVLSLGDVLFMSPDLDEQPFVNLTPVLPFTIKLSRADFDRDTRVNQSDLAVMQACDTGPGVPYDPGHLPSGCTCGTIAFGGQEYLKADFDNDGDVDQDDFGLAQLCYSGSQIADANCGNELVEPAAPLIQRPTVSSPTAGLQSATDSPLLEYGRIRNAGGTVEPAD